MGSYFFEGDWLRLYGAAAAELIDPRQQNAVSVRAARRQAEELRDSPVPNERMFLAQLRVFRTLDPRMAAMLARCVPAGMRTLAWATFVGLEPGAPFDYEAYEGYAGTVNEEDESAIEKDILRTKNDVHADLIGKEEYRAVLTRLMRAFCAKHPEIGYCQGMSYIFKHLLDTTYLDEHLSFAIFDAYVTRHQLAGLWTSNLSLVRFLLYALDRLIEKSLPDIFSHFKRIALTPLLYASSWFPSLFTYSFPVELGRRLWDILLVEGFPFLLKVALAFLKLNGDKLLGLRFEKCIDLLKSFPSEITPDILIDTADSFDYVTPELLLQLKNEFLDPTMENARVLF